MDETGKTNGESTLEKALTRRADLNKVREELVAMIVQIKASKEIAPYLRELIAVSVRIPKTLFRFRMELSFGQIQSGHGVVKQIENWCTILEKANPDTSIVIEAYLYPYEQGGGRKLMGQFLKFVPPPVVPTKPMAPAVQTEIITPRKKVRARISESLALPMASTAVESAAVPTDQRLEIAAANSEAAIVGDETLSLVMEVVAEAGEERPRQRDEFYLKPIDFDYRRWGLWSTDGTRKIIKKIFEQHQIVTPTDLMVFLGTNNPSIPEWNDFIGRLKTHSAPTKLILGAGSEDSLVKWMRRQKMIPDSFKRN